MIYNITAFKNGFQCQMAHFDSAQSSITLAPAWYHLTICPVSTLVTCEGTEPPLVCFHLRKLTPGMSEEGTELSLRTELWLREQGEREIGGWEGTRQHVLQYYFLSFSCWLVKVKPHQAGCWVKDCQVLRKVVLHEIREFLVIGLKAQY